jgi:hypothetical protein
MRYKIKNLTIQLLGVYLEIEGGGEESSRTSTTVEVEVLLYVRVECGTTETGGSKFGVKWKWDY